MNNLFQHLGIGLRTYFASFGFINRNGLGHYYLYPVILVVIMAIGTTAGIQEVVDWIEVQISSYFDYQVVESDSWWETVKHWFLNISEYVLSVLLWILFIVVYHKISKYVILILLSPVMALLSERTDEVITGRTYPFEWRQFLKDIWRGMLIALRNMMIELVIVIALWILNIVVSVAIPPITFITTPAIAILTFLIGGYFYGFSTMDYTNERKRMDVRSSVRFIRAYKGVAVANGSIFALWIMVPLIGPYLGTVFAPITCTVGATLAIDEVSGLDTRGKILVQTEDQ